MKIYNKHNFFKHTYCEFSLCDELLFNQKEIHYKSKKGSVYHYTNEGVYRFSNHWGRVANCRWKIEKNANYKNQNYYLGFANWTDFYPLNDTEKLFYITADVALKTVEIHHIKNKEQENLFLFSVTDAKKRKKEIIQLLSTDKWAKYFKEDIETLRKQFVSELISTDKTSQEIKSEQKK